MQGIDVSWSRKEVFAGTGSPAAGPSGYAPQWTVTVSKQLGPHKFEESLTIQQLGAPPVIICRDYELRAVKKLEQGILWHRELAEEGMAEN